MKLDVIAKIDVALYNGATTRLLDFCREFGRSSSLRLWLQRRPLPPVLGRLEVCWLPAPTPGDRSDFVKSIRALYYEASLAARMAWTYLRRGRPDAVLLREVATVAPGLICKLFSIPLFLEIDGYPYRDALEAGGGFKRLAAAILRLQGRMAAGLLTYSPEQARSIASDYGLAEDRVLVVPNGADTEHFRPAPRADAIGALGLSDKARYVLWAGSLRPNQEMDVLLEAIRAIRADHGDVRLLLVAPEVERLRRMAAAARVEDGVVIRHVEHRDVPTYISAASVCVAPWRDTPRARANAVVPLKLLEYLACGRASISADLPWLRFVEDGDFGLVYRSGDSESLAAALKRLLCATEEERDAMGAAGCEYVREHNGWASINGQIEGFIRVRSLRETREPSSDQSRA